MLAALLGSIIPIVYVAGFFITYRFMFAILRRNAINKIEKNGHHTYLEASPVYEWERYGDKVDAQMGSFFSALLWPVAIPGYCLMNLSTRIINTNSIKSDYELAIEKKSQAAYVDKLEKELRLGKYADV